MRKGAEVLEQDLAGVKKPEHARYVAELAQVASQHKTIEAR